MESGAMFRHVLLWTAVLITVPAEGTSPEYLERKVYQCAVITGKQPIQGTTATHIWYYEKGLIAFATTLDWTGVKALYAGFSKSTCHCFGKVKYVIPKKESMVTAQGLFDEYHSLSFITRYFAKLAETNKKLITFEPRIGKSFKGLNIFAVHITLMEAAPKMRPKIYIQCLIHAREWISGSVCMYLAQYLVKEQNAKDVNALLKKAEFVIVPVVNPDGYLQSWKSPEFRFWRKNMRSSARKLINTCEAVDLNRNFPFKWKEGPFNDDGKLDTCSETYSGPHPVSEPEVLSIMNFIVRIAPVYGAIDFHSYGQDVLHPYLYTDDYRAETRDHKQLSTAAALTAQVMSKGKILYTARYGETYDYPASGSFVDWAYSEGVAKLNVDGKKNHYRVTPLAIELRPEIVQGPLLKKLPSLKKLGFLLSKDQILPTCVEAIAGIMTFAEHVIEHPIVYNMEHQVAY